MNKKWQDLTALLAELHSFPTKYVFKFIVPIAQEEKVLAVFPETKTIAVDKRHSSAGQYVSLTLTVQANSSQEIVNYYQKLETVPGIISL